MYNELQFSDEVVYVQEFNYFTSEISPLTVAIVLLIIMGFVMAFRILQCLKCHLRCWNACKKFCRRNEEEEDNEDVEMVVVQNV